MKKIAVVGAGVFGCTVTISLTDAGYDVDLYEKKEDILTGASKINQLRLHHGFHYPRSPETVKELCQSIPLFEKKFSSFINYDNNHYYCIAKENSFITASKYLEFCNNNNLWNYEIIPDFDLINRDKISLTLLVEEGLINYEKMKSYFNNELFHARKIGFHGSGKLNYYNYIFTKNDCSKYDYVINCTYAGINQLANEKKIYQYELCEKILVKLPKEFEYTSIVVLDGPFMCIDPYLTQCDLNPKFHLLGNVEHAIHKTTIDYQPLIPYQYIDFINNGYNRCSFTNFEKFIESGKEFIPGLEHAEYIGSGFTIRTVLPNVEATDARPTLVSKQDKIINVFSGKIDTAVSAANQVVELVRGT